MYLNYTFILIKMCFYYTFIKILGFLYKKMVTLYDNTLKRYYHNNLFNIKLWT